MMNLTVSGSMRTSPGNSMLGSHVTILVQRLVSMTSIDAPEDWEDVDGEISATQTRVQWTLFEPAGTPSAYYRIVRKL
jgi:hypothetical protein